jgi:lipopolysaccharide transport system permease protein
MIRLKTVPERGPAAVPNCPVSERVSDYEIRIRPNRTWLKVDWRGIWEYRDLLYLLVRRDFVSKYTQTVLGPAWFVIQPLLTTVVFTIIFGKAARLSTDELPPTLFYLCGLLGWSYFANTFTSTSSTLVTNAGLFGKVYFPRLVVPLSTVISNLFAFAIQFTTFVGFWLYFKLFSQAGTLFSLRWEVIASPLLIVQIGALSLGVGLWMSALTAKYRDFTHLSSFLIQLWMYATPIVFPLSMIPAEWRIAVVLNPMTMPIENLKYMFLGSGCVDPAYTVISVLISGAILVSGLLIFQNVERSFVDTV